MAMCSHCGNEARSSEQFCQYCGRELLATNETVMEQPEAVYAASGAPLSWNSSQPQVVDPSNGAYGSAAKVPQARLMVRPSPTAEPGAVVDDGEREFLLDGRDIAVGRAPSCDIVLAGDQLASRRHALLRLRDETYTVVDLGSSNGTYVNDEEIHTETPLNEGDRVTVGGHDLIFSTAPASPDASIPGTVPAPQQNATLLETSPIAAVNLPQAAQTPDAWQQPAEDAPLAEPDQLADAGEAGDAQATGAEDDDMSAQAATDAEAVDERYSMETVVEPLPADTSIGDTSISDASTNAFAVMAADASAMPDTPAARNESDISASESVALASDGTSSTPASDGTSGAPAATDSASAADLDALRSQLAEISTALSRKADEEYKLAGRLRAALVEVRDQLAALAREHGGGSYSSSNATEDYSGLATIARQAADHPRHLDYLSSLSDAAGDIADALETKQSTATGGGDSELLAGIEALRARLDETLG